MIAAGYGGVTQGMRIFLVFCLLALVGTANATLRFGGEEIALPPSEWRQLNEPALPQWQEQQQVDLQVYNWVPLDNSKAPTELGTNLLRTDIHVAYAGTQAVLLVIPYAFIPEIKVGVVRDGQVLMWKDLDQQQTTKQQKQYRSIGIVNMPFTGPGDYQLIIQGSNVANSIIINDARLMLNDEFMLHQYPLSVSITSSFIGAAFICLWMCIALLLYRFMLPFAYALVYILGAIGTLLLREGILFISLPLDVSWWAKHILPFCMGLMYSGLLCYVGADLKRSGWQRSFQLVTVCGVVPFWVGVLNIFFPTRDHMILGLFGFVFALVGFISSLIILTWRALVVPGIREKLFALVFGSFFFVMLIRTATSMVENKTTISVFPWYVTILLVAAYIFVEYILMLTKEHVDNTNRRTADSTRFDLVSRFSHELRTPLNAVIGLADLLKDSREIDKVQRLADMIQKAGNTLLQLVNDILDFSKLGSKQVILAHNKIRLDKVVSEVMSGFLPGLLADRIAVQFNTDPGMAFFYQGDDLRLKQVLGNLMSNAVKFSKPDGAIIVSFKEGDQQDDKVELLCSIRDQGRGIPDSAIDSIFEPFSQVEANDSTEKGGTGLGLAICKLLVEQMGGHISVSSELGQGSEFSFNIWLQRDPAAPDLAQVFSVWQGKKVLLRTTWLYEDSPIKQHLGYWGARLTVVNNFSKVPHYDFDVVITDTGMLCTEQEMDWLRALPETLLLHIIEVRPADWLAMVATRDSTCVQRVPCPFLTLMLRLTEHVSGSRVDIKIEEAISDGEQLEYTDHQVLLVDDNTVNLVVAGKMLSALDIPADMAEGGAEALQKLKVGQHYTMVLLDCEMPGIDGFEVARRWRQYERDHDLLPIPIVALTAHAMDAVQDECLAAGMNEVIFKPINRSALVALFNRHATRAVR